MTADWNGLPAQPERDAELDALVAKAKAAYDALSPVDRALHDSDQRRSFVRGLGADPGPDVLAEEVRRLRSELAAREAAAAGAMRRKLGQMLKKASAAYRGAKIMPEALALARLVHRAHNLPLPPTGALSRALAAEREAGRREGLEQAEAVLQQRIAAQSVEAGIWRRKRHHRSLSVAQGRADTLKRARDAIRAIRARGEGGV